MVYNKKDRNPFLTPAGSVIDKLVRDNIRKLKPYSSARSEFTGKAAVFLDANENANGSPLSEKFNRYPDPLQWELKFQLSLIKKLPAEQIFIGNGSDEVIDLAFRIFCEPGKDNVIICPPTYGMYAVSADINNVECRKVSLTNNFQLNVQGIRQAMDPNTKLLFICSPNNPTANNMDMKDIQLLISEFQGIVVIDEAYIDYTDQPSFIAKLAAYPNLIVMQTLSKAWGMAALRLGLGYASREIIQLFNKVKPPYNINEVSQRLALEALHGVSQVDKWVIEVIQQKKILQKHLIQFSFVKKLYPSDANFIMVRVNDADVLYQYLSDHGIVVRNRSKELLCENCLRITIGTKTENENLLSTLKNFHV